MKSKNKSMLIKLLSYKIPVYQVAAGAAFLIGAFVLFQTSTEYDSRSSKTNLVTDHPTIGVSLAEDEYPEELVFNL